MKVGIRAKLVLLMAVVGALPLVASLVGVVYWTRELRTESLGLALSSLARTEGRSMRERFAADIESLMFSTESLAPKLAANDNRLPQSQIDQLDAAWPQLSVDDEPVRATMRGPLYDVIKLVQHQEPNIREIIVADRHGQLVAATGKSEDFYQGDEDWFTSAMQATKPLVIIGGVTFDRSADAWGFNISLPVFHEGKPVGAMKTVLDVRFWLARITSDVGAYRAQVAVVDDRGRQVWSAGGDVQVEEGDPPDAAQWRLVGPYIRSDAPIRIAAPSIGGAEVQMPEWWLRFLLSKADALAPLDKIAVFSLAVGIGMIGLLFLLGLALLDRGPVRRLAGMTAVVRAVAAGELDRRIPEPSRRLLGRDELDMLADSFNHMVDEVQRGNQALREANAVKTRFIQVASHELRTPVSYITGMAHLLRDCQDAGRLRQGLSAVGDKAERLAGIVRTMLQLLPAGKGMPMQFTEVRLPELLAQIRRECELLAESRGQTFNVLVPPSMPPLRADADKLHDVIENLVMNAIKFTPDGGQIEMRCETQLGGHVSISVRDQGPGIPERELPHLFEPLYTGGDVLQHSSGVAGHQKRGLGLGLAIVRAFVEMHGGAVHVTTSPNGSTFTIVLPGSTRPDRRTEYAI
jgi:signal transduction histidine kinase